jgi:hypothetical protein
MPWRPSVASSPPALMNNEDQDLESALRSLRPRAPRPAVAAAIAAELDAPARPAGGNVLLYWASGLSALAACLLGFLFFRPAPEAAAPTYRLVRAEQPAAAVDVFAPLRLEDGSFVRPVRVRWDNRTQWEDRRTNTRLVNYSPSEELGLVPLETY